MSVPEPVILAEYEERSVALTAEQERTLRALAGTRLTILPGDQPDIWRVKAGSFVGTLVTPDIRLLIRPKVSTANLFHLLEASGQALNVGPEVFDYDTTSDLLPAFATFFVRHLEACLSRGIARRYEEQEEALATIRGRVDLIAQLRMAGVPLPVACRFDEYTANTPLNRIVRAAAVRLVRLPGVTVTSRRALLQLLGRLEEVGPVSQHDLASGTRFDRLNGHYRPVERLARLVLGGSSLRDASGASGAAVFLIDMNRVFEEFVEARLRKYLAGRFNVRGQLSSRFDVDGKVRMRPDLVLDTLDGRRAYVADTKYKITADGLGREGDYYQILAYTTALRLDEGLLIYCQHDGEVPAALVTVGPDGKRLVTCSIGLDRSVAHVEAELRSLAERIADRVALAQHGPLLQVAV